MSKSSQRYLGIEVGEDMDVNAVIRDPNKTLRMMREVFIQNTTTCPSLKPMAKSLPVSEDDLSGRCDGCLVISVLQDKSMQQVISNCVEFAADVAPPMWLFFSLPLFTLFPLKVQAASLSPFFDMTSRFGPQNVTDMEQSSVTKPLMS